MGCCASNHQKEKKTSNNGKIDIPSEAEFEKKLDDVFLKYYKDGSGSLNRQEVTQLLKDSQKEQGATITPDTIQQFLNCCDKNRNGTIEKD